MSGGLTGAGGSKVTNTPGNLALVVGSRAIVPCHTGLSKVLPECSHDMAAGFPWNEQVKREPKKEAQKLFMT